MNIFILLLAFVGAGFIVFFIIKFKEYIKMFGADPFRWHATMLEIDENNYEAWRDNQINFIVKKVNKRLSNKNTTSSETVTTFKGYKLVVKRDE